MRHRLYGGVRGSLCKGALYSIKGYDVVTSKQIADLFVFQPKTNAPLYKKCFECGFLEIVDYSNKARKYKLAKP